MRMIIRKSALLGAALLSPALAALAKQRPNIIFFLVDDYGWVDSSVAYGEEVYPGNLHFHTPNMERLARKGVILTSAYACPVSTPTRTAMMSGMNAAHMGITNWTSALRDIPSDGVNGGFFTDQQYDAPDADPLGRPDWNINGLCPDGPGAEGIAGVQVATPMVRHLRDAGYYTIHMGKAHWAAAGTPGASPYNMGFMVNVAGSVNGMPRSYYGTENFGNTSEKWNYMAVQNMAEICRVTEENIDYKQWFRTTEYEIRNNLDAISHATCSMAIDVHAKAIVVNSRSGITVRMVSRFRCPAQIVGITTNERAWRKLNLSWGVIPVLGEEYNSLDVVFYQGLQEAKRILHLKKNDNVVLTGGQIGGLPGNTNTIKVETIR